MKKLLFTIILLTSALIGGAQIPCWDGTVADAYAGGNGTLENPYQIATPEQLALLAEQTNNGTGGDAYYILTEDICLNGSQNYQWSPIGNETNPFTGVFDGDGHTISELFVSYQVLSGLFGFTQEAIIKDVHLEEANIPLAISGSSCIGLIVGKALNTNIFSCSTHGLVGTCPRVCGGIVGLFSADAADETFVIKDCVNHADIISETASYGGGIAGQTTIENGQIFIENCVNYGNLNALDIAGGIVGEGPIFIKNCDNYGALLSNESGSGGGIVGSTIQTSVIEDCVNHESGEITAMAAGGIVGNSLNAVISRCGNKAKIKGLNPNGTFVKAGGITSSEGRISNCYNTGEISLESNHPWYAYAGGISGAVGSESYIRNCYVTGAVVYSDLECLGIIAMVESTSMSNCYWHGDYDIPPVQGNQPIPASSPFVPGATNSNWILEEAQYGTTDLLEALNRGSMGECLWVEDLDGINGGLPIPTEGEIVYPLYGNEWYYEIVNNDGSITHQHLEIAANDTTIHHKDVVIIIKTNTLYDKGNEYQEVTHEYIYQEGNVVYWYNKNEDDFTVLYDFGAVVGDEWIINVDNENVLMHVDSIAFVDYEGETYRKMKVVSDHDGVFSGDILCGVGHTTSFFPENLINKGYRVVDIRCYWNGEELIQKWSDTDCDEVFEQYHTGVEEPLLNENIMVYPNPTITTLIVITNNVNPSTYRITNPLGQTLLTGPINGKNTQINVKSLPQGLYFITVDSVTQPFFKK